MVTQALSWRWLFFITVVPGLAVAWAVWSLVDIDRGDKAVLRKFDGFGALLLAVSLGSLQYVLHEGPRLQWLDDDSVKALLLATTVAGALLLWRCLRRPAAILDLGVFRDRNFTIGCLFNVALGAGLFVGDYLMTQYLGRVRGLNSQQIGETLLVTGAFEVLGAPVSLWLATRVDPRIVLGLGYALFGFGLYLATGMTADWDFDELFWSQAVRGFSLMLCFVPVTGLALGTLPARQAPDASGLFNLTRNVGGAVGLAWVATALQDRTALHYDRLAESLDAYDPLVQDRLAGMAAGLSDVIGHAPDLAALRIMSGVVRRQAEVMAFNDLLLMLAGIVALAVLLLPFVRRKWRRPGDQRPLSMRDRVWAFSVRMPTKRSQFASSKRFLGPVTPSEPTSLPVGSEDRDRDGLGFGIALAVGNIEAAAADRLVELALPVRVGDEDMGAGPPVEREFRSLFHM